MWETVELRELRIFLTLADELHFGRTAERLHISQSRVSQAVRMLERQVGAKLFDRTSRHVALTPIGGRLRETVSLPYREMERGFEETRAAATGVGGTLRIGMYFAVTGGPHMLEVVKAFEEHHPGCKVEFVDTGFERSQFDWLRTGDADLLAMRLPITEPGIVIGPLLSREDRVLALSVDHPLADRDWVEYEDVADYAVSDVLGVPRETMDAFIPPRTRSGRRVRRMVHTSIAEFIMRVATGACVHPTVSSFPDHIGHPGITTIPIRDLPPSESALGWLEEQRSPKITAFAETAADVLAKHWLGGRPTSPQLWSRRSAVSLL
jgi:DNA-binding transcriptional LysR family regulator